MGKVFSFSQIVAGDVPSEEKFIETKNLAKASLADFISRGEIYGAKIFGSVASGTANERSDFDILIITEKDSVLPSLKSSFKDIFKKTNVGIEPLIVSREYAERGFHSVDRLFAENIGVAPIDGNLVGQNPLDILRPSTRLSLINNHEEYLIQKVRRFKEGLFSYSESDKNNVLQRTLEAPVNMGRESLQILPYFGHPLELEDIGKQTVVNKFREVFSGTALINGFNYLYDQDKVYSRLLMRAINGLVQKKEYDYIVNNLSEQCVIEAISWVDEICLMRTKLLEGNRRSPEGSVFYRNKELFR